MNANVFFPSKLLGLLLLLPCTDLAGTWEIFLVHAIIKINKMHFAAPETISTCTMITFAASSPNCPFAKHC